MDSLKIILLSLLCFFWTCISGFGQDCGIKELDISSPIHPIYDIRVSFHIIQDGNGNGNFKGKTAEEKKYLSDLLGIVNWIYSDIQTPDALILSNVKKQYYDSKIRFKIVDTFYHPDERMFDYRKWVSYYNPNKKDSVQDHSKAYEYADVLYSKYVFNNPEIPVFSKDSTIHVFLAEGRKMAGRGIACGILCNKWFLMVGAYQNLPTNNTYSLGAVMAHEMGHNLGLSHVHDFMQVNDLKGQAAGKTNNLMDSWPNQARALSPGQIKLIYDNISNPNSIFQKMIEVNPKTDTTTLSIKSNDTLNILYASKLFRSIKIENGGVLNIKCGVQIGKGVKITMKKGSKMIIDGVEVSGLPNQPWDGIYMQKSRKKWFFFKDKHRAQIEFKNNGFFIGTENGITKF